MEWYKININDVSDSEYSEFFGLMCDKKKVLRYKNIEDKKRSVCGEMLARRAISKMCGIDAKNLVFETKKSGKPYCKNADIEFSISHSGDYAVCAVSDKPIGIDIQKIAHYSEKTAKRVCSEKELSEIEKSEDKDAEFIKLWTKKEAILKRDEKGVFSIGIKNCLDGEEVETVRFLDYFVSISK